MGYSAIMKYAYPSTRVKAMEAKLLSSSAMKSIATAKDVGSIMSVLIQTDYNKALSEFGGIAIKHSLIDFALSKNMAERLGKLIGVTPKQNRSVLRNVTGKLELNNVKLAIEAKDRNLGYDAISSYIIDYGIYNQSAVKEAMREPSIEDMLSRFMKNSPYADIIKDAIDVYKSSKDAIETVSAIDVRYYKLLGTSINKLLQTSDRSSAILRMDIDMRNLLILIRAKKRKIAFSEVSKNLISNGNVNENALAGMYNGSEDVSTFAGSIKSFDLKEAIEQYKKNGQLIAFEIGMRNSLFAKSLSVLRCSTLSFASLLAYVYLKETEVFALRILIKSKMYGLSEEEISRLITWKIA